MFSLEAEAQKKFRAILDDAKLWTPYRQMVRNVLVPHATRAFTLEDINTMARILDGLPEDASLVDALNFYMRKRVVRRRKDRRTGKTYYEVIL